MLKYRKKPVINAAIRELKKIVKGESVCPVCGGGPLSEAYECRACESVFVNEAQSRRNKARVKGGLNIAQLCEQIHNLLCQQGKIRGGKWDFSGWLSDGRAVRHRFDLNGYERKGPTVNKDRIKLGLPNPPENDDG